MTVLGVIGGMGPAATVAFLERLQALTPASGDADHIRVVMDLNPQVPDRNSAPGEAEAVLVYMGLRLREAGADILAMPCNTAHVHAPAVARATGLSFLDMIDETVVEAYATGSTRPGVLATGGGRALYAERIKSGRPVLLDDAGQADFMALIYRIKAGDRGPAVRAAMRALADRLIAQGADALIAGCTEVPLALSAADVAVPLIDSTDALARASVRVCAE